MEMIAITNPTSFIIFSPKIDNKKELPRRTGGSSFFATFMRQLH